MMVSSVSDAVALVNRLCHRAQRSGLVQQSYRDIQSPQLTDAVRRHDTAFLFDWLMHGFSFQGISDRNALAHIARHGNASWFLIEALLADDDAMCPKLDSFASYRQCGYRKTARSCNNAEHLDECPVPAVPLRKGDLNQLAFSLYLFIRDRCGGDLIAFIDTLFRDVSTRRPSEPIAAYAEAIFHEFGPIHAVSGKLIAMMIGSVLIAAKRPLWRQVGQSLVTIDTLVHNFLHRTGIMDQLGEAHGYGDRCYRPNGCATAIARLADRIDAREFHRRHPRYYPRYIELVIWSFCAESHDNICNGVRIDDRIGCLLHDCPVFDKCKRTALRSTPIISD